MIIGPLNATLIPAVLSLNRLWARHCLLPKILKGGLDMICSSCGQENAMDAKVCVACGQSLAPGLNLDKNVPDDEAKTVALNDVGQGQAFGAGPAPVPGSGGPAYAPSYPPEPVAGIPPYMGPPPQGFNGPVKPIRDYMAWAIIATVISGITCNILSLGLGIPAIIFSSQAREKQGRGDAYGAHSDRKTAQIFFWISFAILMVWVAFLLLYLGIFVLAFLGAVISSGSF